MSESDAGDISDRNHHKFISEEALSYIINWLDLFKSDRLDSNIR